MADSKSFEDQFDHDPNAVYEEEEDLDLGPDDEFADKQPAAPQNRSKRHELPKGSGCIGMAFKIFLSLSMIACCYFYIFRPELFTNLHGKISEIISSHEKETDAPVLSLGKKETEKPALRSIPQDIPTSFTITLNGSGVLPDFTTAAKQKPSLNAYLAAANKITFETLDTYHFLVKNMIADWAGESDEQKISEMVQMPYKDFFNKTSASLLSQTLLIQAGVTPINNDQLVVQPPVQVMASLYPLMKSAMAGKTTIPAQLQTIEPVSSFLIYICHDDLECMASWDLLIDMLGIKQFSKRLEKAPETVYMRKE